MQKNIFFILFLSILCSALSAQSSDSITKMLDSKTVTFNEVSYFAAAYLDLEQDTVNLDNAASVLQSAVKFPKLKNTEGALCFKDFAYICMRVWNIPGSLNYRLFKSPRYALRELKALRCIPPFTDPDAYITGRDMLYVMSKCAAAAEVRNAKEKSKQNVKGKSK